MKNPIIVITLIAATAFPLACARNGKQEAKPAIAAAEEKHEDLYYCPMHPTVTSHEPGKCPICGMTLVKRTEGSPSAAAGTLQTISLSPEMRVTGNVRTTRVVPGTHTGEIVTTGRVTFDERRAAQVTTYTAGRIERLFVNFTGDTVRRGQTVATIYSPDLFSTQQEYLLALDNRERMRRAGFTGARSASDDLVESTRRRLMLFGMTAQQVASLESTRKPIFATNIISSVSGIVTNKLAVEQQYVSQGQALLEVADLSHVWVEADIYEQQLPSVHIGDAVEINAAAVPGRMFNGKVSFIVPVLAGATRTARVRVDIANPGLALKPDMYVNVRVIGAPAPPHIMVPASAVIDRGQRQFVWVESGAGSYEPREVTTGGRHGESIVILTGLSGGDNVVVEGGFLLDSEAQLRGTTTATGGQAH